MLSSIVKHYGNGDVKPVSLAQTQKEDGFVMGDGVGDGMAGRENGVWMDDAASTGTAFRDENGVETDVIEDAGTWANNLFYAYARRVSPVNIQEQLPLLTFFLRQTTLASPASSSRSQMHASAQNGGHSSNPPSAVHQTTPAKAPNSFPSTVMTYPAAHGNTVLSTH